MTKHVDICYIIKRKQHDTTSNKSIHSKKISQRRIEYMQDYFQHVANSLTHDDMKVLAILMDNEANAGFKAMKNADVLPATQLSEATYRRIIYRLSANKFVEIVTQQKMHMLYITEFGMNAIRTTVNGVGA
jgi:hypothetical protein